VKGFRLPDPIPSAWDQVESKPSQGCEKHLLEIEAKISYPLAQFDHHAGLSAPGD
jgi:hypothetical protein